MAEFIDSEAHHDRLSESIDFRDESSSSDSAETDSSQSSSEFISKSTTKRKRRLTFTGDESSDGERRSRSREKETRKKRDHVTHRHTRDRKVLKELQNILLSISKASTGVSSSDTTPSRSSRSRTDVPQEVRVSFTTMDTSFFYSVKPGGCTLC